MAEKPKRTASEITAELANKIEKGKPFVKEYPFLFLHLGEDNCIHGCAIGMAFVGHIGNARTAWLDYAMHSKIKNRDSFFSTKLQVPGNLLRNISEAHLGRRRITTIIKHLRQGKFDKFVDA